MTRVSHGFDRIDATFDDPNLVTNAGLLLPATLSARLGIETVINTMVRLVGRVGGARPGRKVLTLVQAMVAGATHIDHADMLRAGGQRRRVVASGDGPLDVGDVLAIVHVRACPPARSGDRRDPHPRLASGRRPRRPASGHRCRLDDLRSRRPRQAGRRLRLHHRLGYHPILATRADTGEILHARLRKGAANTQRGAKRFIEELVARVRRAGASGELVMRFDSGFWSNTTIDTLTRLNVRYTLAVRTGVAIIATAITGIADDAWQAIGYTPDGEAQVADTMYTTGKGRRQVTRRLVVRRTRLTDTAQQRLWPEWRHHRFLTDLDGDAVTVDAFHRQHAVVELAIRDLKEGAGLEHVPSGRFFANAAWLCCTVLAHNLIRWTATLGDITPADQLTVARTIRTRLIAIPARLVNRSGIPTLRLPTRWSWRTIFTHALHRRRALDLAPG